MFSTSCLHWQTVSVMKCHLTECIPAEPEPTAGSTLISHHQSTYTITYFSGFVWNPPVFLSVVMESTSPSLCCNGICQSFILLLWNPSPFCSVAMESTTLSFCCHESTSLSLSCYGIHQSFALLLWNPPVSALLLWNPPVFCSVAMESTSLCSVAMEFTSLSLCCHGIHHSFVLLQRNPPVFHSVAMESTTLSLCCSL